MINYSNPKTKIERLDCSYFIETKDGLERAVKKNNIYKKRTKYYPKILLFTGSDDKIYVLFSKGWDIIVLDFNSEVEIIKPYDPRWFDITQNFKEDISVTINVGG